MNRWLRSISERPGWILLGVLFLTSVTLLGLVDLRTGEFRLALDPSPDTLLPAAGPERDIYERSRRLFGTDEAIVVALGADDVFTPEMLKRLQELTRRIERIDGVSHVLSLGTAVNIRSVEGELVVGPLLETIPEEPAELERLRREALANPIYAGTLISRDASATALLVSLDRMSDRELIERGIDQQIVTAAREEAGDSEIWISGLPHIKSLMSETLSRELSVMSPAIVILLVPVLFAAQRSLRGILLPIATVLVALLWTLGTLGWLRQELNLVTTMVPFLILTIGFTYAMHVASEYYAVVRASSPALAPREAARESLAAVGVPVLATGLTTAAAFLSLSLNPIVAIRQLGLFSLLGVGFTVLASLTLAPAVLAFLPVPPGRSLRREATWLDRAADGLGRFAIRRRGPVIVSGIVLLGVALIGMSRIRVASEFEANWDPDAPVRRDYQAINDRLGGANEIRILLDTDVPEGFLEPSTLGDLESTQQWLRSQPEVGETISIVDYVRLLHRALRDDDPSYFTIPETKRAVSQLLLFGASHETSRLVDARYQTASVLVRVKVGDSDRIADLVARIENRLATLPQHLSASVTGSAVLLNRTVDDVARGQRTSLLAAFVLIYLVLVAMFTSFRVGLRALFPNFLPIAVYFGTLGFSGITLNPVTSIVGCLALGIAVDDTIHYLARFNADAKRFADEQKATLTALHGLIRPVTFTTLGLCLGFLVLTTSEQRTLAEFGLLAALTIAVAWLVDITLTPALCAGVRIVTLWDVLRFDLGPEPQRSISLFEGLSLRQARIFALMSDVRRVPAGQSLFREGDEGLDMYVILEGQLLAWLDRDGSRIELSTMERGIVVGEVGYFAAKRTANVTAVTDARLIRFDSEDLERLRRRYPRTAAIVFRNLNQIQAERLIATTQRLR